MGAYRPPNAGLVQSGSDGGGASFQSIDPPGPCRLGLPASSACGVAPGLAHLQSCSLPMCPTHHRLVQRCRYARL